MRNRKIFIITGWIILVLFQASCSKFRQIQKSDDWEVKYRAALEYYDREDYYKASVLIEEILPILRGRPEAERIQFYFAYSYYYQKQYIMSAHYFKTFYTIYSRSEYAEEAMYMHAYSLYLDSPDFELDQTNSREAIASMQSFINRYPQSKYANDANQIIDQLQLKLERKAYENAVQYYKLEKYNGGEALKAALIAFENFQDDFPDSNLNEDICYLKIEAAYNLAKKSIRSRMRERLLTAIDHYQYFIDNYPQSEQVKSAENIYVNVLDELDKLQKNNL
ncbi:MAG: outer membrane protein assembly factor BamD [Cyclobacteriaceae bacterium]|nr:outer membrane protein assembly factor BamD [Cyclobacteriaceae bacterium]